MGDLREEINKWIKTNDLIIENGIFVPRRKPSKFIKEVKNNGRVFNNERRGGNTKSTPGDHKPVLSAK